MNNNVSDSLTGSWLALVGVVVSILAHFNIIVTQDSVAAILAGCVALYGLIHQFVVSKAATGSLR